MILLLLPMFSIFKFWWPLLVLPPCWRAPRSDVIAKVNLHCCNKLVMVWRLQGSSVKYRKTTFNLAAETVYAFILQKSSTEAASGCLWPHRQHCQNRRVQELNLESYSFFRASCSFLYSQLLKLIFAAMFDVINKTKHTLLTNLSGRGVPPSDFRFT